MAGLASIGKNMAAVAGSATIATITGLAKQNGKEVLNDVLQVLASPSLCYIPIATDSIEDDNEADIANSMIIAQPTRVKTYLTDNVAPKPRTWTLHGYISALLPIVEDYLLIKPTLLVQKIILLTAFKSRDTVPFKTDTGEIVDVVIKKLKIKSLANAQNAYEIDVIVQEVELLTTTTVIGDISLNDVAKASVVITAVKNLGKCLLGSAAANATSVASKLIR